MSNDLEFQFEVDLDEDLKLIIQDGIKYIFSILAIVPGSLTILFSDDQHIQQLNRDFRQIDKPTDVLSFPGGDPFPGNPDKSPYLGDIIISVPTADRQAKESGHSLAAELHLLVIHGALHLLGYDHDEPEDKKRMWAKQEEILTNLGFDQIVPTES